MHRDLTPTNIFLFDENNNINLKVCDFGLGKDPESLSRMANSSIGGHDQWMFHSSETERVRKSEFYDSTHDDALFQYFQSPG